MTTNLVKLYTFQCNWLFDNWATGEEIEKTSQGIVTASSYAEAITKITQRLPYANNICLNEDCETDFVFLSKDNYKLYCESDWGLDAPEEDCNEF